MSSSSQSNEKPHRASTSSESIPESYHGYSDQEEEEFRESQDIGELHRVVTQSRQSSVGPDVLTRLSTLSQTLSHMSHADMQAFHIDPNDFDLKSVLKFISSRHDELGVPEKKTWVVYDELSVIGKDSSSAVVRDVGSLLFFWVDWVRRLGGVERGGGERGDGNVEGKNRERGNAEDISKESDTNAISQQGNADTYQQATATSQQGNATYQQEDIADTQKGNTFQQSNTNSTSQKSTPNPAYRHLIHRVNGIAEPGTLTLVLGRPGAGCSTLLKALAGQTQAYEEVQGVVSYGGIPQKDLVQQFASQLVYVPELDEHFPYLTVEQTLEFAIACKTPAVRVQGVTRRQYIRTIKELYAAVFGLHHVQKTLVGGDFVRGISGGQRKRVSIAEAMATRGTVYCYDNATRGLDASTALEFVRALRTSTNFAGTACVVTAYQASESIYQAFDHVCVLYAGRQVYFGPADRAVAYFERLGFARPARQTSSEFLTCVTDPDARTARPGFEGHVPHTAGQFESLWRGSPEFAALKARQASLQARQHPAATTRAFREAHTADRQKYARKRSLYLVNYPQQLALCLWRAACTIANNTAYTVTNIAVAIVQALITGSLYFNTPQTTSGAFSRSGILFFAIFYFVVMGLAQIAALFQSRPILNKQRGYTLYHPSAQLLSAKLIELPIRFFTILAFSLILYFLSNLKRQPGAFFFFLLFVNVAVEAVASLFTLVASCCPTLTSANALTGILMMLMILYSSFMIQRPSMYWWFRWFSYANPVLYGFESLITSEFLGRLMPCSAAQLVPHGSDYSSSPNNTVCAFVGAALTRQEFPSAGNAVDGSIYLSLAFQYSYSHAWRNLGILFGFILGADILNVLLVEYYNPIVVSADRMLFVRRRRGVDLESKLVGRNLDKPESTVIASTNAQSTTPESTKSDSTNTQSTTPRSANAGSAIISSTNTQSVKPENTNAQSTMIPSAHSQNTFTQSSPFGTHLGSPDIFLWRHVDYVVPYEGRDRKLLDDVQGYVLPGTLTALMGESGAGKTTLLNVLSQRTDVGVVTGDFLVNGNRLDTSFQKRTGYVQQQDIHIAELTVRESLVFAARLRRPYEVPDSEKLEYVDRIMEILHMDEYADAVAGKPGYGLNVEQRKKLSIATELVAKPSLLLFLDEPTSGLDSQSAWAIVQVLRKLALAGQAILCTIHQPSATLFEQFDRLLLLKKGGQTVYFGPVGRNSHSVLSYFESKGARRCQPDENPAEYVLEVIGAGATAVADRDWGDVWRKSEENDEVSQEVEQMTRRAVKTTSATNETSATSATSANKATATASSSTSQFATPYHRQLSLVLRRTWTQFYRDIDYLLSKLLLVVLGGLVHGFSFWKVKHTTIGMQNTMFANFMAAVIAAPLINQIQARAIQSRELFEVRESKSSTFHWSTLLLSQLLVEIPYALVNATIYFIVWYFPIQLPLSAHIAGFWWLTYAIFFQIYIISFALAVIYFSPDLPSANVLCGMLLNFLIAFCGVIQPPSLLPGFWKFMWRTSSFTYFIDNLVSTCLHDRQVRCSSTEMNYLDPPDGLTCNQYLQPFFATNNGYVANPSATSQCAVCQYSVGDQYLATVGMSYSHRWRNIGLFFVYILFNVFCMLSMYYIFRVRHFSISLPKLPAFLRRKKKAKDEEKPQS